jgi:hypothetical protein
MDQSEEQTAKPLSRVVLGLVATAAGSLLLAWFSLPGLVDPQGLVAALGAASDRRPRRFSAAGSGSESPVQVRGRWGSLVICEIARG